MTRCHIRRNSACTMKGLSLWRQKFSQEKDTLNNEVCVFILDRFLERGDGRWLRVGAPDMPCKSEDPGNYQRVQKQSTNLIPVWWESQHINACNLLLARDWLTQAQRQKVRYRSYQYFCEIKMSWNKDLLPKVVNWAVSLRTISSRFQYIFLDIMIKFFNTLS